MKLRPATPADIPALARLLHACALSQRAWAGPDLAVESAAHEALPEAVSGDVLTGELGFAILHRCGEHFYFLLIASWRNENELWETVWAKTAEDAAFAPWITDGPHHPAFCVWELRAVCHEQRAWSSYLRSSRDAVAKKEYLKDTYTGLA